MTHVIAGVAPTSCLLLLFKEASSVADDHQNDGNHHVRAGTSSCSTGSHQSSTTSGRLRRCYMEEIEAADLNTELYAKNWFPWTFSPSQETTGVRPPRATTASVSFVNSNQSLPM